jgi:hypothetical protein
MQSSLNMTTPKGGGFNDYNKTILFIFNVLINFEFPPILLLQIRIV